MTWQDIANLLLCLGAGLVIASIFGRLNRLEDRVEGLLAHALAPPAPAPGSLESALAVARRHIAFLERRFEELDAATQKTLRERDATCARWRAKLDAADARRAELEARLAALGHAAPAMEVKAAEGEPPKTA